MADVEAKVSSLDGQRSLVKSFATTVKNVASTRDPDDSDGELILPMIDSLKKSRGIQEQVNAGNNELSKGKCESQRRGTEIVFVKKKVSWPQNFILGGNSKSRISYDKLSKGKWVSGFPTIIKD